MGELIEGYVAIGTINGERVKGSYLRVGATALHSSEHPSHQLVTEALDDLAERSIHNHGLEAVEIVWAHTYDPDLGHNVAENLGLDELPQADYETLITKK